MKKILIACFFAITFTAFAMPQETQKPTILTDNLCDLLCKEAPLFPIKPIRLPLHN